MLMFIVGMLAGAGITVMILALMVVVAEEEENLEQKARDPWRWYLDGDP